MSVEPRTHGVASFCERVIECGGLFAVITTPLYFNVYSSRIFEPDKALLLRSIALIILAAWLVESWCRPARDARHSGRPFSIERRRPLAMPVLAIAATNGIALTFSVVPRLSLLGSYERLQGTLTTAAYLTIFTAVVSHFRRPDQVSRIAACVALTSVPVALYALAQHYGWDPLQPWDTDVRTRPFSSLGNPIFLGGYLAMSIPVVLGLLMARLQTLWTLPVDGPRHLGVASGYGVVLVVSLVSILLTQSRGPLLALYVGLIGYWCVAAAAGLFRRLAVAALVALALLPLVVVALIAVRGGYADRQRGQSALTRWESALDTSVGSVGVRTAIWKGVIDLMTRATALELPEGGADPWHFLRPVVGYGPESLALTFHPAAHPDLTRLEGNTLVDRAHNETLDTLATSGVIGVIAFLWLFTAVVGRGLTLVGSDSSWRSGLRFHVVVPTGGLLAGVAVWRSMGPAILGVAIPLGMVAGILVHLGISACSRRSPEPGAGAPGCSLVLIGLLAAVIAHFVEVNFGVATVATRTHFWVFAALLALDKSVWWPTRRDGEDSGSRPRDDPTCGVSDPGASAPRSPGVSHGVVWKDAAVGAILLGAVLMTLGHDLFAIDIRTASWGRLFSEVKPGAPVGTPSWAAVGLFTVTWLVGSLLVLATTSRTDRHGPSSAWWTVPGLSLALGGLSWLARSQELVNIARITPVDAPSMLLVSERIAGLSTHYVFVLLALIALLAWMLPGMEGWQEADASCLRPARYFCTVKLACVAGVTLWLVHAASLRPVKADTLYNVGRQLRSDRRPLAIELFRRADALAPYEMQYALELHRMLNP